MNENLPELFRQMELLDIPIETVIKEWEVFRVNKTNKKTLRRSGKNDEEFYLKRRSVFRSHKSILIINSFYSH